MSNETETRAYRKGDKQNHAYQYIRNAIIRNQFTANQPITEKEISTKLDGMSRTPIRDALMRLVAEGLVERIPGKGLFVAKPSITDLLEITEIRFSLETTAVKLFTERADNQIKQELKKVIELHEKYHREGNNLEAVNCDNEFHFLIAKGSMNQRLNSIISKLIEENSRCAFMTHRDSGRVETSIHEHTKIYEAIMAGDGELAAELLRNHLRNWLEYIKEMQFKNYYLFNK